MTTAHAFIATSLDGFIARPNGDVNWLMERDDPSEDHGYGDFIANIDMIVMGRGTYEKVLEMGPWPYDRPVLVMSTKLSETPVPEALMGKVNFTSAQPVELMLELAAQGVGRVYVDGGKVVQAFLRAGLICDLVITVAPVLLGQGRPLFGAIEADVDLKFVSSRSFPSGLVQSNYRVVG
ncbi:dihydrofolate reductase family protein [Pseudomonas sp. WOUb67]|uniref:dihydrofolate reductase family protein n=1 Tax=Pseudomonas sp. WOUb67 TaxID=3161136 RepID=UPI003CF31B67